MAWIYELHASWKLDSFLYEGRGNRIIANRIFSTLNTWSLISQTPLQNPRIFATMIWSLASWSFNLKITKTAIELQQHINPVGQRRRKISSLLLLQETAQSKFGLDLILNVKKLFMLVRVGLLRFNIWSTRRDLLLLQLIECKI